MYPFRKTILSIQRARLTATVFYCALLAATVWLTVVAAVTWFTDRLVSIEKGWLDALVNWIVALLGGVAGWFVLPVLTVLISSLFQESIIERVERSEYPQSARNENLSFGSEIRHDLMFTLEAVGWNVLILPLYAFGIGFAVSFLLNGYLLGREFFETVAGYHLGKEAANRLFKRHRTPIVIGGLIIMTMALIPLVNLFVPVVAVVWMVHVYHALPYRPAGS